MKRTCTWRSSTTFQTPRLLQFLSWALLPVQPILVKLSRFHIKDSHFHLFEIGIIQLITVYNPICFFVKRREVSICNTFIKLLSRSITLDYDYILYSIFVDVIGLYCIEQTSDDMCILGILLKLFI